MAFLAPAVSRPRHRHARMSLGVALLAGLACLTTPALADEKDLNPSEYIPTKAAVTVDAATVVLDHQPAPTNTSWSLYSPHEEELRLKERAKDEEEEEEKETKSSSSNSSAKDEDEEEESTKKSSTKDDEGSDDEIEDETRTVSVGKATATDDEEPARTSTMVLSVTRSEATEEATAAPLPVAFDANVASEFKSQDEDDSCPNFITNLLGNPDFQRCYPLSMMMQTSGSFFEAEKQLVSIVRVLDATCGADVEACSEYMHEAARNLTATENCETEWNNGLTTVMQAYRGLMAYEMMYAATCLQDPESESYCFATAVTNTSTPSDTYLYFLPYNLSLPGSSTPSCTWCIQETMGVFHSASADRKQLVATTYESAARQVNTMCGTTFVNGTLPEESTSGGPSTVPQTAILAITLLLGVVVSSAL